MNNNQNNGKSNRTCSYCGKYGHKESKCRNKKRDEESANVHEVVFNCVEETSMKCVEYDGKDSDISVATKTWIADSGASCHMTNSDEDLSDVKMIDDFVKIGNGKEMRATKIEHPDNHATSIF